MSNIHQELASPEQTASTLAIPGQTTTGKESSNLLMADSLPKTIQFNDLPLLRDGQAKTITEASLKRHLKLEDNGGITSLPNTKIFEQLALMGYETDFNKLTFQKVGSLENELMNTKKVYGSVITKLVKRVKKLEKQVKTGKTRRRTKIVLSEDEAVEEDSSKQGRGLIKELDMDANFYLVPLHDIEIQEKISDDTKVTTTDNALNTACVPFSTTSATPEVSTAAESLVYIRRSEKKKKDKGKAIVIEDESVQRKSKKQVQEERLGYEEAIRL
ncbi:hypothetical protein Tco_0555906 [Tanacetum coccineum]